MWLNSEGVSQDYDDDPLEWHEHLQGLQQNVARCLTRVNVINNKLNKTLITL